jgi:NADPH2:quinone reductase
MLAIKISQPGGPDVLKPVDRPIPIPGPGEVLVRVHAAGVNRPDILQRLGRYPPPPGAPADIPGLELAGTITAVGPPAEGTAPRWTEGDTVCALVSGGAYAEYCTVPDVQCLPIPAALDFAAAAAVPETYFTVWVNLFQRARLQTGETVLIHGGSSGIGTTAIQLARAAGATIYATAGSREKCAVCEQLGAAHAINYNTMDFVQAVNELTSGRGVNVILDIVGGEYLPRNIECLAVEGRLAQIGLLGGGKSEINLAALMQKRLTITGSTLRIRSVAEKGAIARELEQHIWPLIAAGRVAPVIDRALPLTQAAEAHRLLEAGQVVGKIVLLTDAS